MVDVVVVRGKYAGRTGKATEPNALGNVMFYPVEGEYPYRVCLPVENIKFL